MANEGETRLIFETFKEWEKPWFSEYLEKWDIGVSTAIDFTASNGNHEHADSKHYFNPKDPEHKNDYLVAIDKVLEVLDEYDSDKKYPVYGFGAAPKFEGNEKYKGATFGVFELNGNPANPEIDGV